MVSMSPLRELINSNVEMAPGGGTWSRLMDIAGRTVSLSCEILWMFVAALANPKESAEGLECQMKRSSASCASWKWGFHFYQVRWIRGNPLNLDRLSGNIFSARRERDATETSHASDIARPDRLDFHCASSQREMNYGNLGSSTHQDNIP